MAIQALRQVRLDVLNLMRGRSARAILNQSHNFNQTIIRINEHDITRTLEIIVQGQMPGGSRSRFNTSNMFITNSVGPAVTADWNNYIVFCNNTFGMNNVIASQQNIEIWPDVNVRWSTHEANIRLLKHEFANTLKDNPNIGLQLDQMQYTNPITGRVTQSSSSGQYDAFNQQLTFSHTDNTAGQQNLQSLSQKTRDRGSRATHQKNTMSTQEARQMAAGAEFFYDVFSFNLFNVFRDSVTASVDQSVDYVTING